MTKNECVQQMPKRKVSALHVSSHAWIHILKAGGKLLSFDHLGLDSAMDSTMDCGPRKGQRYTGPRNPSEPQRTLCLLQGTQLQKPTPGLTLLLKRLWLLKIIIKYK